MRQSVSRLALVVAAEFQSPPFARHGLIFSHPAPAQRQGFGDVCPYRRLDYLPAGHPEMMRCTCAPS